MLLKSLATSLNTSGDPNCLTHSSKFKLVAVKRVTSTPNKNG